MSRLWSRSGLRVLSVLMLVFALVGGAYLGYARHSDASQADAAAAGRIDAATSTKLNLQQAAQQAAYAPMIAAQQKAKVSAQHSANAAAIAAAAAAHKAEEAARAAHTQSASRSQPRPTASKTSTPSVGPVPSSCSSYSGNRAIGCTILLDEGFAISQMPCLDKMWTKESGWSTTAENASSGAYGIPQALPASKMGAFGSDYRTNPTPQIKWGLSYIKGRYSTPCGAWSFWQAHGWY